MTDLIHGIDVSSHQPRDLTALIQQHQPQHVVVKLYQTIESIPQEQSADQIASALASGCTVGGYVWLYHGVDPAQQVHDALELAQRCGVTLPILWIDLELYEGIGPTLDEALTAARTCDALGVPVGIYTGNWFVKDYWDGEIGQLVDYPVWLADYNGQADLDTPSLYWPAERVVGHQYQDKPIDFDVFDPSVVTPTATADTPTVSDVAPSAPTYEDLANALGYTSHDLAEGLEAEANREGGPRPDQILAIAGKLREQSPI
jgi:GH25 family lysozyme M1 (1,4-beta-N-acetylmuramidase)